ncbi:MAG: CRISPR-associated endoribonuclease Cas6 [Cyclobacteriaceae bacterium]|nr:CRISPR-associated endoribonuclease Cas6 [Cyclobacteriaceae bacterium]MBX2954704.1 CRISPR-associated endoribonuclease Cas6 [Cyclobacteriaceae bacterium]HRJ28403.1 CRISPR-associated endoribonuclease Cas6 [Cyclobacteriaceae bacterium]HRJ82465.1 CRISPR-associated endoribonuclease Cas6 [Cyclobacteriaceae bacterium]
MRTRIIFSLKNRGAYVPFHHQYLLAQFIKGLLMFGPDKTYQGYTQFNFSGLKGQTKISRKGLHYYSSKVTLVFACADREFLSYFTAQLFEQKDIMIGSLHLVPDSIEEEPPVEIQTEAKFLCISPIVPVPAAFNNEQGKKFIMPESDEFSDLLYDSTISRMEATGKYTPEQLTSFYKFQLVPDPGYLQRLQAAGKKFARIYPLYDSDVKFEVRGYTFPFTLYAAPEVQRFVYENGLGYFCHKGFGMLDVAGNDSIKREQQRDAIYA